jgi:hypothetical protein
MFVTPSANAAEGSALTHTINLQADVPPSCTFGEISFTGSGFSNATTFTVPIAAGGTQGASTGTLSFDQFSCNARLRVDITGKGYLENKVEGITEGDFARTIPYEASFSKDETNFTTVDFSTPLNNVYLDPSMAVKFKLKIDVYSDSVQLSAGRYADTLVLYFYPQI